MASICSCTPICCASPFPTARSPPTRCACSRMWRGATTAATAISPRGRTSSSTGSSLRNCPTRWPISRAPGCTACRPAAIACATSRPINGPASRPTRSRIRAAVKIHDIGLRMYRNGAGETGFEVTVGGGLGRTPFLGKTIKPFLPKRDLLSYVEAIMRTYNQYGRRDNIYKARIKILVHELGAEKFAREVEEEWQSIKDGALALDPAVVANIAARFRYPGYEELADNPPELAKTREDARFRTWLDNSVSNHKVSGRAIVTLSLKPEGGPPGDATAAQMDAIAELADRYSHGEIRVGHEQNLALPHVAQRDLPALWRALDEIGVATPNVNLISDIIACPGLDYCSLANARSIPVAQEITRRFRNLDVARDLGRLHINISGCINACGHHHIGHIGILGVEKNGEEYYQVTIGGRADERAELGAILGPAVPYGEIADVVEDIAAAYLELRARPDELFIETVKRVGVDPFKERVYAAR